MSSEPTRTLVCVLCGEPWLPGYKNVCECGGFCTWGERKGGPPSSWDVAEDGRWTPKPRRAMSGLPRDREPEREGLTWLLVKLMNDEKDGGSATVETNGSWITVTVRPDSHDTRKWAIWRNTGAVYVVNPEGDVPDDPLWQP